MTSLLAAGGMAAPAHAAATPVAFSTAAASPKTQTTTCPATVKLAAKAKVRAPIALKYQWVFSNGDKSAVKTYRVDGKDIRAIRLNTAIKVGSDARGWGQVRLLGPVKKASKRASFSVTCTGGDNGGGTGGTASGGWLHFGYGHGEDRPGGRDNGHGDPGTPPPPGEQNPVKAVTLKAEERHTVQVERCPMEFGLIARFDVTGAPAGSFKIGYRVLSSDGAPGPWLSSTVPAGHGSTHKVEPPGFQASAGGWRQIEVQQPNGLKSNQAAYKAECTKPGITLSKASGHPGDKATVTVVNSYADIVSIVSDAFTPAEHKVPAGRREYSFEATVSGKVGPHEVRANFSRGTDVKAAFTVEKDLNPVKGVSVTVEESRGKDVKVCPKSFAGAAVFDVSGAPAEAFEIKYRVLASDGTVSGWLGTSVPANHDDTHKVDLGRFSTSTTGWRQVEVQQPNGLKSNQAAYKVECTEPGITLGRVTGKPGEKVKVTVVNGRSDIRTITSEAFTPAAHTVGGSTREYSFDATVSAKVGAHEVKALFADNTSVKATFTVEADANPVKSVTLDLPGYSGAVLCPKAVEVKAIMNVSGLPAVESTIRYRYVEENKWYELQVPANHAGTFRGTLAPFMVTKTGQGQVTIEIDQPNGLKTSGTYHVVCGTATIVVDPPNATAGQKVTVTVDGVDTEVSKIGAWVFKQPSTSHSGKTKVVQEAVLRDDAPPAGKQVVTAELVNGAKVYVEITLYRSPLAEVTLISHPKPPLLSKVTCPYAIEHSAVLRFSESAPKGSYKMKYVWVANGVEEEPREVAVNNGNSREWILRFGKETFTSDALAQVRQLRVFQGEGRGDSKDSAKQVFSVDCK
ncbi:hypothetical protein ABT158_50130 [Nonomuraea sp. NPDC001636]|uniref:hypothetical protein n=1 Tax=Nonomuraea sp. NPDC001636 TaxID=3154391 RepID=UPI00331C18A5